MDLKQNILHEKRDFFIRSNGAFALPTAGAIYWVALGIAGLYLSGRTWFPIAAFTSGLIFPLGLLMGKLMKVDVMAKSALSDVLLPAFVSMLMFWPLAFAGVRGDISFAPLIIGVGMGIHWPVIGWLYGRPVFMAHAAVRTIGATALWFLLPDARFTAIPFFIALVYLITVVALRYDVNKVRSEGLAMTQA